MSIWLILACPGLKANVPSEDIHEQRSCRTFHRLNLNPKFGSHWGVGLFQWVEIQYRGNDLVGDRLACSEECAKAIKSRVNENGITVGIISGPSPKNPGEL